MKVERLQQTGLVEFHAATDLNSSDIEEQIGDRQHNYDRVSHYGQPGGMPHMD